MSPFSFSIFMMIKRAFITLSLLLTLAGCGSMEREPTLEASGYIADAGVVRLWSKVDGEGIPMRLLSVYTPFSGETVATHYEFIDGKLKSWLSAKYKTMLCFLEQSFGWILKAIPALCRGA